MSGTNRAGLLVRIRGAVRRISGEVRAPWARNMDETPSSRGRVALARVEILQEHLPPSLLGLNRPQARARRRVATRVSVAKPARTATEEGSGMGLAERTTLSIRSWFTPSAQSPFSVSDPMRKLS